MQYLTHIFGQFFSGFTRNPLRVIGTMLLLSVLFFVTFLLMMFSSLIGQSVTTAEEKVDLVFFIEKGTPDTQKLLLKAELDKMKKKKEIQSYSYESEAEALQQFAKKYPARFLFLKRTAPDKNPMDASFVVTPLSYNISDLTQKFSSDSFSGIIDIQRLLQTSPARERSKRVLDFLHFIEQGITLLIGVILFSIAGIIATFISSSFMLRQKEIFIMRLVGASYSFIRAPFLVEGILSTLISLAIGWVVFLFFRDYALSQIFSTFSSAQEAEPIKIIVIEMWTHFSKNLPVILSIIVASSMLISFLSIERLLRKKRILQ